ncbi:GatB/YqeY domain-containing protein [Hyphomicrobium sp. D-2]|uniref:GatB/YqeY domain-containing protein n=1 Tax=Hyphomicrobium sp. D-2 TaxID=3041621 RepID=UPI0024579232|nr:GatB/YqeY domain-containing protein [Hyphomicrobium sp. D-2]MDH4981755.1 GatB/YqeY domain-containing protein [Hyphomicrobium sp. D-2]
MRDKINDDLKAAMKGGNKERVATLRLINAAIKAADIDARPSGKDKIDDADILTVLAKMVKQRRDSIEQFTSGGRPDLAEKELAEVVIIEDYLPQQMTEDEIKAAISAAIAETGAAGAKDMGKVMGVLKGKYAGQMDFGKASGLAKSLLG